MSRKVLVIGAGVGGLAVAALLAGKGMDVAVFESTSVPGGRCSGFIKDGFTCDFGVHMFSRGAAGPHGEVARRVSADLEWVTRDPACRVMGAAEFDFPLDIKPLSRMLYLARKLKISPIRYLNVFLLFRALMSGRANDKIDKQDAVTVQSLLDRYTGDEKIHRFVNCLCQLYFAVSYQEASAGEFMWCFSSMFNDASFGYPRGGGGRIPEAFRDALEKSGGRVNFDDRVMSIRITGGKAAGVECESGFHPGDIVISNAGLERTAALARHDLYAEDALNDRSWVYSNPYLTIKYALSRPVIPCPVVFYMPNLPADRIFEYVGQGTLPEDPYIFMPVPSNLDPSLAPPGKQLVIAGTAAPKNAGETVCGAILDRVHEKVCELFADIPRQTLWEIRTTRRDVCRLTGHETGEAIGLAQIPGQTGALRPNPVTAIPNLYLVGADAGARGIGTEMASASALVLSELILARR